MDIKQQIAYHEAGHAVAAALYGRSFVRVTISGDSEGDGFLKLGPENLSDRMLVEGTWF